MALPWLNGYIQDIKDIADFLASALKYHPILGLCSHGSQNWLEETCNASYRLYQLLNLTILIRPGKNVYFPASKSEFNISLTKVPSSKGYFFIFSVQIFERAPRQLYVARSTTDQFLGHHSNWEGHWRQIAIGAFG